MKSSLRSPGARGPLWPQADESADDPKRTFGPAATHPRLAV